jgi:hypothetical protein
MIAAAEELIDKITETMHYLRIGKVPQPIPIPGGLPDNEMRQLLAYLNRFLVESALFAEAMAQIARAELDTRPSNQVCRLLKPVRGFDSPALPPICAKRRRSRTLKPPDQDHFATNCLTRWKNFIKFKEEPG